MRLHIPIALRWGDLDAYGHVNNVDMLRLLEEARVQAFWATDAPTEHPGAATAVLDGRPDSQTLTLVGAQRIEYLAPVPYLRRPLDVQLWLGKIGGGSLLVCYEVHAPAGTDPDVVYARASATIVLADVTTQRPRRISREERRAWEPYLEDPVSFGRA